MVRAGATARGWVWPAPDRHMHQTPLPRLGGVAIYLSFLISITVAWIANRYLYEFIPAPSFRKVLTILLPGTLIFLLGIYDDIRPVGPYFKFAVQAVAAVILFAGGLKILAVP